MAVRHRLITKPPMAVWGVLEDGSRYADWVVGTSESRPVDDHWPELNSQIEYTVRLGPWTAVGRTIVRRVERPRQLELEVDSGPLGTARIAIEIRPWGADALVILDEHPLRGPGGALHNSLIDALLQVRHRSMLSRLADVVEQATAADARPTGDVTQA
ncbi:SRPBCC family protein [Streptomyces sp. NPDC002730]|uniref:SRPBCC family protein n=1 Tax=Streptomyces sp. NPDC002730 TaxID=3364662 RepID=UPI00367789CD